MKAAKEAKAVNNFLGIDNDLISTSNIRSAAFMSTSNTKRISLSNDNRLCIISIDDLITKAINLDPRIKEMAAEMNKRTTWLAVNDERDIILEVIDYLSYSSAEEANYISCTMNKLFYADKTKLLHTKSVEEAELDFTRALQYIICMHMLYIVDTQKKLKALRQSKQLDDLSKVAKVFIKDIPSISKFTYESLKKELSIELTVQNIMRYAVANSNNDKKNIAIAEVLKVLDLEETVKVLNSYESYFTDFKEYNLEKPIIHALYRNNIKSFLDIECIGIDNLKEFKGIGEKSISKIKKAYKEYKGDYKK